MASDSIPHQKPSYPTPADPDTEARKARARLLVYGQKRRRLDLLGFLGCALVIGLAIGVITIVSTAVQNVGFTVVGKTWQKTVRVYDDETGALLGTFVQMREDGTEPPWPQAKPSPGGHRSERESRILFRLYDNQGDSVCTYTLDAEVPSQCSRAGLFRRGRHYRAVLDENGRVVDLIPPGTRSYP